LTRLERSIAVVLRGGVMASTLCLACGVVLTLAAVAPDFAESLMHAGILILLSTPVARVAISIVEYATARDWRFAALTAIVLVELMASAVAALVFNQRL